MIENKSTETSEKKPGLESHIKFIIMAVIFAVLIVALSIYNIYNIRSATDIDSVDALSGQRIACCVGWESDLLLSDRDDITLLRYDTNAECIMGLSYGQVDAVAIDEITIQTIMAKTKGLEIIPGSIASIGDTFYASFGAEEALNDFNEFADKFVKSDEYQPFHDSLFTDVYKMADVPEIEDGKKLVVGYVPDSYPESYLDFNTGEPAGYGIELMKRFAYEYGYTIEWVETTDSTVYLELALNNIDFATCYISDVYRAEVERAGKFYMTQPYLYGDVCLVKVKDGEKLQITGEIEY